MSRDNFRHGRSRGGRGARSGEKDSKSAFDRKQKEDRDSRRRLESERKAAISVQIQKQITENNEAIRQFKENVPVCEVCGEPISDLSSAVSSRQTGNPVHFDCVIKKLYEQEKPGPNDKITYIGNGKFAVLHFDNVHDMRHFSIVKEIQWEPKEDGRGAWRDTMAGLYSQVK